MNSNLPPNLTVHQPLIFNPLTDSSNTGTISPGASQFIVTESFIKITTESLIPLVTEK